MTDTISWLKLVLDEASIYIRDDYKHIKNCINSLDYSINYYKNAKSVQTYISDNSDKLLQISAIFKREEEDEYYGNMSFQSPFYTTLKFASANSFLT